jgi:hypothetical protein
MREKVLAFEALIKQHPQSQAASEFPTFHHFAPGLYARELHVPAGTITIGRIHKYPCLNIMSKGDRSTLIGEEIRRVRAPFLYVSSAGSKRISFTHSDCVWITVHATQETNIKQLERDLTAENEKEYQDFLRLVAAERPPCLS